MTQNCGFKDAVSAGHKHVFASNTQGGSFIEVFSIMKGVHVASVPTCGFPYLLDYVRRRAQNMTHRTAQQRPPFLPAGAPPRGDVGAVLVS